MDGDERFPCLWFILGVSALTAVASGIEFYVLWINVTIAANQGRMARKEHSMPRRTHLNLSQAICAFRWICAVQSSSRSSSDADLKLLT